MKRLVILSLIVAGVSLSLNAQVGGRVSIPSCLACLCEESPPVLAEQVGPLCNPLFIPIPLFVRAWIDPLVYNQKDFMNPIRQDYRPYKPGQKLRDISAPMPRVREQ
ncbi:MAG TPA: hypothetical protein P5550_00175 [Bacteroidales bacterium]|nr:hypothetical protein [Bacteroidales bacterium]